MRLNQIKFGLIRIVFLIVVSAVTLQRSGGQVTLTAEVSDSGLTAGQLFDITLAAVEEIDFYYAEVDISFDGGLFEFVSVGNLGLSEGGISVAGLLYEGRTGASVSRTEVLDQPASGPFMRLFFRVKSDAFAGLSVIAFHDPLILDPFGEPVPAGEIAPLSIEITGAIVDVRLHIPAQSEIDEGELFNVEASVFASGISDTGRLLCQVGIGGNSTDPAEWEEGLWSDMLFTGTGDDHRIHYRAEVAFMRPAGEWHIAVRSNLDGGDFVYGGINGVWHPEESPGALLTILPRPPYRYTLAKWDFNNESYSPFLFTPDNAGRLVSLHGASLQGFPAGYSGLSANSNGWAGDAVGSKYWMIDISTKNFASLELSSRQYGSGTGPRDFILEYSPDGENWQSVDGGEIMVGTNWTSGILDRLPLPAETEEKELVSLRWSVTSGISIGEGTISNTGTNRIDDIVITGINPASGTVTVYPGDTNNDGVVNADDVLALGTWWLYRGPPAVWQSAAFIPRSIEQWIPAAATWADTNGDGVVDHRDLAAIGLHFGKTAGGVTKDSTAPLSTLIIDPVADGRNSGLVVMTEDLTGLRGIAFSISVKGIPPEMWEIRNSRPAFENADGASALLDFEILCDDIYEAAFVLKGRGEDIESNLLAGFELVTADVWNEPFSVELNRVTRSSENGVTGPVTEARIVPAEIVRAGNLPDNALTGGGVRQNYPNPFSKLTTIPFSVNRAGNVLIEIVNIRGTVVAVPVNSFLEPGYYEISFDGGNLPPGIYFYRFRCGGEAPVVMSMIRS